MFVAAPPFAAAQEPIEPVTPPPPVAPPPPPVTPSPPPPLAWQPPPSSPTPLEIDAVEASGRHKKRIGAVLMATGGTLMLVGTGLIIGGTWENHCFANRGTAYYNGRAYYYGHDGDCADSALTLAGATTTVLGVGALVPGIIEHVSGANDIDFARRVRRACSGVCWRPTFSPGGGGVELEMQR
jgi:hypothetical protein